MAGIIWRQWPLGKYNRGAVAPWHGKRGAVAPWHKKKRGAVAPWHGKMGAVAPWHGRKKNGVMEHGPPLACIERGAAAHGMKKQKKQKKKTVWCSGPMAGINRGMGPPWQVLKGGSGPRAGVQWPLSMEENIRYGITCMVACRWRPFIRGVGSATFSKGSGNGASTSGGETTGVMLGQSLVPVGPGFPALPRKLVERIRSNEYVDFMELPPAKGRSRPLAQAAESQIVVVQAVDMTSSRRIIPIRPSICPESSGTVPNFYLYICPVTDTPKSLDCPGNSPNEVAREK